MKYLKKNKYGLCALVIISFAVLLRILLVSLGWPSTNSDEGTMGMAALHIAYHGEHPVLYYGQNYMGVLEAYLGALFFHLFGASLFTLRLGTLLLFSLFLVSTYLLTSLLYSKKFALVVLILLSLGSNAMFVWEIYAKGGSTETLLFGSLSFLFAAWLALSRGQNLSSGKRWLRYACYGCWGLAIGLGLWSDMIVVPYFVMSALLLFLFCWRDLRSWAPLCLLLGFAIGMLPLIKYNLKAQPGQSSLDVFLTLFHGSQTHTLHTVLLGIVKTVGVSVPTATGIPACPVPALSYANNVNPPNMLCSTLYKGWGSAYLLLWALATFLALQSLWKLRPHYRLLYQAQFTAKHKVITNQAQFTAKHEVITTKQAVITVYIARFFLLASAGLTLASYAVSSGPISTPASHGRYLIGLLIITPAVLWPLWHAASRISLSRKAPINRVPPASQPIEASPPLVGAGVEKSGVGTLASPPEAEHNPPPVGAGVERSGVGTLASPGPGQQNNARSHGRWSSWLSAAILLLIGIAFLAGTIGITGEFPATQAFNQQQGALIHDLIHAKITHIYTDYWTCNRIAFVSNEQIICGVIGQHLQQTHNRYMRYWLIVSSDPHSAYVLPPDHYSLPTLEKKVAAAGGDKAYQRFFLDGYVVYLPR